MKVSDILNEEHHYQIIGFERDGAPESGSSKQGNITANYHDLVKVFGEPHNHTADDRADVNYEWNLQINYKDPQSDDSDSDSTHVSIYDYRQGEDDRHTNPTTIDNWTVGAMDRTGMWVLYDLLKNKGLV